MQANPVVRGEVWVHAVSSYKKRFSRAAKV